MRKTILVTLLAAVALVPMQAFACDTDADCGENETCMGGECVGMCEPDCKDKNCGPNMCGGECGYCIDGVPCVDGICDCTPKCDDKECGPDGCGGFCGLCGVGCECAAGNCICCDKQCDGKSCGDDGCGGSCGACQLNEECIDGQCTVPAECQHECDLEQIGCDGVKTWTCVPDEDECRKKVVAECPEGQECEAGECATPTPTPVDEGGDEQDVMSQPDVAAMPDVAGGEEVASPSPPDAVVAEDVPAGADEAVADDDVAISGDTGGTSEPTSKKKSGCQAGGTPAPGALFLMLLLVALLVPLRRRA
jgi:MYXO-CTERM domain-containing protein